MKTLITKLIDRFTKLFILFTTSNLWAALPKPPDADIASGNRSWIDVGDSLTRKALTVVCIAVGGAILIGVAAGTARAYHVANERGELGHFFKMIVVGLIAATIGMGLLYAGYQIASV